MNQKREFLVVVWNNTHERGQSNAQIIVLANNITEAISIAEDIISEEVRAFQNLLDIRTTKVEELRSGSVVYN